MLRVRRVSINKTCLDIVVPFCLRVVSCLCGVFSHLPGMKYDRGKSRFSNRSNRNIIYKLNFTCTIRLPFSIANLSYCSCSTTMACVAENMANLGYFVKKNRSLSSGLWSDNHLEKMKVNGKDDSPYLMKWNIKFMVQTTNQSYSCLAEDIYIHHSDL